MTLGFEIKVDPQSFRELQRKLAPEAYREALSSGIVDLMHVAKGAVKDRTPVVTGNLRNSEHTDVRNADKWPNPSVRIFSDAVYAWWIETGETKSGRKMRVRAGGYRMFEEGAKATEAKAGAILDSIASEIQKRWAL